MEEDWVFSLDIFSLGCLLAMEVERTVLLACM